MSKIRSSYSIRAVTAVATAAIVSDQALVVTGERKVAPATGAAGEKFAGFAKYEAAIGQSVGVTTVGQAAPVAGADITSGTLLKAAAGGKVVPAADGDVVIGRAESDAVNGEQVTVEVTGTY